MAVRIENVFVRRATEKALLVVIEGDEYWIPQSQITDDSEVWEVDQIGELVVTDFIADQRGLS